MGRQLGTKAAAKMLGLSLGTFYNYRCLGLLPAATTKPGRNSNRPTLVYDEDELREWVRKATCPCCGQRVPMAKRGVSDET